MHVLFPDIFVKSAAMHILCSKNTWTDFRNELLKRGQQKKFITSLVRKYTVSESQPITLSSSQYTTADVPCAHFLPENRPQLDISLPSENHPKFWSVVSCLKTCNLTISESYHITH
jgi:hypothetical protein